MMETPVQTGVVLTVYLGTSNWLNFVPVELNEVHSLAGAQIEFFCRRKLEDKLFFESLVLSFF
jgi:hypothetical protein